MLDARAPRVAIVDYGLGNLFSVKHACEAAGIRAEVTSAVDGVGAADGVILPGMGAFASAMEALRRLDLIDPLLASVKEGKALLGLCLGQQLLMAESHEFGRHAGLGVLRGDVVRFENPADERGPLKVPQVGWNRIRAPAAGAWEGTVLAGVRDGEHMYFVHSYHVRPEDPAVVLARARYGNVEFCAAVRRGNVMACQFHPERSGPRGLQVYRNFRSILLGAAPGLQATT